MQLSIVYGHPSDYRGKRMWRDDCASPVAHVPQSRVYLLRESAGTGGTHAAGFSRGAPVIVAVPAARRPLPYCVLAGRQPVSTICPLFCLLVITFSRCFLVASASLAVLKYPHPALPFSPYLWET
jgi:hypothetical protein